MNRQEIEDRIKNVIVSSLELEDVTPAEIETDAPLFGEGLGLDSIDALELGMAIKKRFGIAFSKDPFGTAAQGRDLVRAVRPVWTSPAHRTASSPTSPSVIAEKKSAGQTIPL